MKSAILLLNMGGANSPQDIPIFLKNMFMDKNIINVRSNLIRNLIASFITNRRTKIAKQNLATLGNRSPIYSNTKKLVKKLNRKIRTEMVMRYTAPFSREVLEKLRADKIDKLYLFPLYPQYSTTTTKSSFEDIFQTIFDMNWSNVSIETISPYFADKDFLTIIANSIQNTTINPKETNLIFSAHSLPESIIKNGDPYLEQITKEIELLSKKLQKFKTINLAFQSKVGPMRWLEPSLETMLTKFKNENVLIYPISFLIDNVETDFELNVEYREIASKIGVKDFQVVKTPNDSEELVKFILKKVLS